MQVLCNSLDDFIANLKLEPASAVLQGAVRVSVTEQPVDGNKYDAAKFDVTIHASAVISLADGGQYLLDYGEACGTDYRDTSQEFVGTKRAKAIRGKLEEFCDDYGLRVRPGIIQV